LGQIPLRMIQEKKCKGTGKAKGYGCGKLVKVEHRIYGLGKMCCYPNWLMTSEPGKIKLNKAIFKASKPRRELEHATEQNTQEKRLVSFLGGLKTVCHNYIKLRDKGLPCISCGTPYKSNFQAGHYFKSELFSTIRFHHHNINGQCEQCNLRKDGNVNNYALQLPERIGQANFDELTRLADLEKKTDHKWDREWLKEKRAYYRKLIKQL